MKIEKSRRMRNKPRTSEWHLMWLERQFPGTFDMLYKRVGVNMYSLSDEIMDNGMVMTDDLGNIVCKVVGRNEKI